jgi:hypothetical protein
MTPHFIYWKMLTWHNLRIWRSNTHDITEHTTGSPKLNIFCATVQQKLVLAFLLCPTYCDWHNIHKHVGGRQSWWQYCLNMMEHLHISIHKWWASYIQNFQGNGLARAGLPLRVPHFTPLKFFFWGISGMLCACNQGVPLCQNLLGG